MHPFVAATAGGALIGLAASLMMLGTGRIAGVSGIFGGLLTPKEGDMGWRVAFVGGLIFAGIVAAFAAPAAIAAPENRSLWHVAVAGVLVGGGVRLGNGCTSGHGVCGLSRLSQRSLVATLTFMSTGAIVTALMRIGGAQ